MKHLRREARAAHTEQHDVGQTAGADAPGKRLDARQMRRDELNGIQPSEAVGNRLLNVRSRSSTRRDGAPRARPQNADDRVVKKLCRAPRTRLPVRWRSQSYATRIVTLSDNDFADMSSFLRAFVVAVGVMAAACSQGESVTTPRVAAAPAATPVGRAGRPRGRESCFLATA